jgi:pyridoxine kinase
MNIVSFQSAVAFGHVGNSAAVFPLQRLGFDVWPVDTVQFSNHPGYGRWTGTVLPGEHVLDVVEGLIQAGVPADCDAVLSGYLGDPRSGEAVLAAVARVKAHCPTALYLCDPVMGDAASGLYVRAGIPEFMAERAIPASDVATPNCFELRLLTGLPTDTVAETAIAARALRERGPRIVVATGLSGSGGQTGGTLSCLVACAEGCYAVRTPMVPLPAPVNGAGDALAALLLAHLLRGEAAPEALSLAVSSLYGVLERTLALGRRELALVAAQDEIALPTRLFPPLPVG